MITYNHQDYIQKAIESVIMQSTQFDYEIIIGDDASIDKTPKILEAYKQRYPELITLVLRKENIGATNNIYDLLVRAKGKYVAVLEGDDYWTDQYKLQKQVDFLQSNKQFIGVTHEFTIVDEREELTNKQKLSWVKQKKIFTIKDFKGLILPGQISTLMFHNVFRDNTYSLIKQVDRQISDRTLIMVMLLQGNIGFIREQMGCYRQFSRQHDNNCTNMLFSKRCDDRIKREIHITQQNEYICSRYFNKKAKFDYYKNYIFVDSLLAFLRIKTSESLKDMIAAFRYTENKLVAICSIPYFLMRKIMNRCK